MTGARNRSKLAASLAQDSPPGKIWVYNNSAIQMLSEVLQGATGVEPKDFARTKLFGPIGMDHSRMTTDAAGNTATFMGLRSTCEDLARFGLLMLRHGSWKGEQVVPAAWVAAATGRPSQPLNASYGYLFWLNRKGRIPVEATQATKPGQTHQASHQGQMHPEAPADTFWALGLGDQIIQMDPGSDTVVVRIGPAQPPEGSGSFTDADTAPVLTEALTDGGH
jgi:CubicO group peptidase (beta-lactamase class C family)